MSTKHAVVAIAEYETHAMVWTVRDDTDRTYSELSDLDSRSAMPSRTGSALIVGFKLYPTNDQAWQDADLFAALCRQLGYDDVQKVTLSVSSGYAQYDSFAGYDLGVPDMFRAHV